MEARERRSQRKITDGRKNRRIVNKNQEEKKFGGLQNANFDP